MTYDDLLTRLGATLEGAGGAACVERLRARYRVVLVDEFQDTDPVQWEIMRRAFGGGGATLVLIGDPKQAIYAFRGADVYAYLDAARAADERATLEVNWRSDQGLIDAYDALFGGSRLGHEGIVYRPVRAAEANQRPRLIGAPAPAPLRVRVVNRDEPSVGLTPQKFARAVPARQYVAKDLAADLVALLSSPASVSGEQIRPGHIAVLVRTHRNAELIRDALDAAAIPAVINGAGSVFATEPARQWLQLLAALERPASPTRAHSVALTHGRRRYSRPTTSPLALAGFADFGRGDRDEPELAFEQGHVRRRAAGPREGLTLGELSRVHRRDALVGAQGPELLELLSRAARRVEDLGGRFVYVDCRHRIAPCARPAPGRSREPLARR